jgi:hypothetical protein
VRRFSLMMTTLPTPMPTAINIVDSDDKRGETKESAVSQADLRIELPKQLPPAPPREKDAPIVVIAKPLPPAPPKKVLIPVASAPVLVNDGSLAKISASSALHTIPNRFF